jgi:hypothetical protein
MNVSDNSGIGDYENTYLGQGFVRSNLNVRSATTSFDLQGDNFVVMDIGNSNKFYGGLCQ